LNSDAAQCAAQQSQLSEAEYALDKQRTDLAAREAVVQMSQSELDCGQEESASRLASLEQQFNTERAAWDHERASVEEQRRLLAKERDDLATALEAARRELATARENASAAGERDELRQKFDLALEDIQRLRARVAELEQELASPPAPAEMDPVELVHLRAERDVMAERIAELEQKSALQENADVSQEQADLQRRFELAVEDVRDLKKKNAGLEAKVAAAESHAAPASSSAVGGSWEAMKKQMLADLADEGDTIEEDRQQERATIENTIRITDEALTRKDREIDELKSRLAEGVHTPTTQDQEVERLVDADEVITAHRARIANLEKETTEKLRAAELEISVERAKIARETAHLEDLKAEIGAQRASGETPGVPGGAQHPKRRWLSKLGLSGEDDEK
jgi:chromosome segregation ATPase